MEDFRNAFIEAWVDAGGLVSKTDAGRIVNLSGSEINRKVNLGQLKSYKMPGKNTVYVSFTEIMHLKRQRKKSS